MTNQIIDNWEVAVSRLLDSSEKLKLLLGEDWTKKIYTEEGQTKEIQDHFDIWKKTFIEISRVLKNPLFST